MKKLSLVLLFCVAQASAMSIDWSGGYRIEYTDITKPTLSEPSGQKNYGLNYLYLQPKIIGSDGINIISRFDVFGNELPAYKNSQLGSFWGNGLSHSSTSGNGSNVTSETSDSMALRVSQLYLTVNQEYGALVAGRAPIEFGMGITHNAGRGAFDHWMDTKDMVGYRFIVDNVSFMPILGKAYQNDFGLANTVSDQIFVMEYDNKDIGARAGVFHQTRKSSDGSNDGNLAGYPGSAGTISGGYKSQTVNVFLERKWTSFEFRLEGSFLTGDTGVKHTNGDDIKLNAYAVAMEMLWPANEGKWEFMTKLGMVSGDDPLTSAYEGYQLDRNYDVAMLLFNHRLGKADIFGNGPIHANDGAPNNLSVLNSADDEAMGNTFYVSPSMKYSFSDKFSWKNTLTYAQLMTNANNYVDFKKDLGLELDTEFIYQPRERVTWSTGVGFLFPGEAWKAGSANNFDNKLNYGLTTKAAITF
jgi:hypothetical protein